MQYIRYIVIFAFLILCVALFMQYLVFHRQKTGVFGQPTIVQIHYYSGKIAMFSPWLFMIAKAVYPGLGYLDPPYFMVFVSVGLLYAGVILMVFGLVALGNSTRIGLPSDQTALVTTGIYRFSRNPLYLGAFTIAIASCCYYPDLINVTFTIYGIAIHHLIILKEEQYLKSKFDKAYIDYQEKVRRYL